jgi:23S rRNA (guanosine2251-2'-O)-methyltransferase
VEKREIRNSYPLKESDHIYGIRAIIEAIHAGKEVDRIFIQKNARNELIKELIQLARANNLPMVQVPQEKLDRITKKNHQGAVCLLSGITYASLDHILSQTFENGKIPLIAILDRITDVRNFGAIVRSAEGAGVHAIVVPSRGNAPTSADAIKTSAGALHHLPICRSENLKETISFLKDSGLRIIGCTEKAEVLHFNENLKDPVALLMGSEDDGISPEYLKMCDGLIKIPMLGKIASLNVSVSAGIIFYEAIRQRITM